MTSFASAFFASKGWPKFGPMTKKDDIALLKIDWGEQMRSLVEEHDMDEWLDRAVRPFPNFILEFERKGHAIRFGMVHYENYSFMLGMDEKKKIFPLPFCLIWDETEKSDPEYHARVKEQFSNRDWTEMRRLAWGVRGEWFPQYPHVYPFTTHKLDDDQYKLFMEHCAPHKGLISTVMSALALINSKKETIVLPASYRSGRTFIGSKTFPAYEPHVVVIQPNAARIVIEGEPVHTGVKHRQHEVRQHTRRLKSGREVPVKSHFRGDPSLGRVEKSYKIEIDPLAETRARMAKELIGVPA